MSKDKLLRAIRELQSDLDTEIEDVRTIVRAKPSWLCKPEGDISSGNLPLHVAVSSNRLSAVKILLDSIPSLANIVDVNGFPAFFQLDRDAQAAQIAELLLDKMSDETVRIADRQGLSFLYLAVTRDWVQVAKKIVERAPELVQPRYLYNRNVQEINDLLKRHLKPDQMNLPAEGVVIIPDEEPVQPNEPEPEAPPPQPDPAPLAQGALRPDDAVVQDAGPIAQGAMQQPEIVPQEPEPLLDPEEPVQPNEPEVQPYQPDPAPLAQGALEPDDEVVQAAGPIAQGAMQQPKIIPQELDPLPGPGENVQPNEPEPEGPPPQPDPVPLEEEGALEPNDAAVQAAGPIAQGAMQQPEIIPQEPDPLPHPEEPVQPNEPKPEAPPPQPEPVPLEQGALEPDDEVMQAAGPIVQGAMQQPEIVPQEPEPLPHSEEPVQPNEPEPEAPPPHPEPAPLAQGALEPDDEVMQAAGPVAQGAMQQPEIIPQEPDPLLHPEEPVQPNEPEPKAPLPQPERDPLEQNPFRPEEYVEQTNNPHNEVPLQIQKQVLPEHDRSKKDQQDIAQYMVPIKQVSDINIAKAKIVPPSKSVKMDEEIEVFREKHHLIKKNIHQLKEPSEISIPNILYTNEKIEQLIALQLPSNSLVKTIDKFMQVEDEFIVHLIDYAINNGTAVILLSDEEGIVLKNAGNETLQLIQITSSNKPGEILQDLKYGIAGLSPWEVSVIPIQHKLPHTFKMKRSTAIENLVKIAKSKVKNKADLLKQLADQADYTFILKKHQLLQEDQTHYSELKFSELLKFSLIDTGTYCTPLTILNRGNDNITKYRYREKIEENLRDAMNKLGDNFDYSAALMPLLLHQHDFAAIFIKAGSRDMHITLINPGNKPLQNEKNFSFLSKVLGTVRDCFVRKVNHLDKFGKFDDNDNSGPLVIKCAKMLSTLKDFKINFFDTQKLVVDELNIDLVKKEHDKILCDKYEIPLHEGFLVQEVQPLGIFGQILEHG